MDEYGPLELLLSRQLITQNLAKGYERDGTTLTCPAFLVREGGPRCAFGLMRPFGDGPSPDFSLKN